MTKPLDESSNKRAKEAEFIVKPLGASGTADPLNQRGTVGEKLAYFKSVLIDSEAYSISHGDEAQAKAA